MRPFGRHPGRRGYQRDQASWPAMLSEGKTSASASSNWRSAWRTANEATPMLRCATSRSKPPGLASASCSLTLMRFSIALRRLSAELEADSMAHLLALRRRPHPSRTDKKRHDKRLDKKSRNEPPVGG